MIIDIPSNLKLPPNFLYNKGVSGRFSVEFDSDFDAIIYFAGKNPIPKGKTQKPLMKWLMSLGITFDDIKDHRNKILDVIRQLTDVAMDSNFVTVPPIPQSFTVENKEESESENNENLDALLASIRSEKDESASMKDLDALLASIRSEETSTSINPAKFFDNDEYDDYYKELVDEGSIDDQNLSEEERQKGIAAFRSNKLDFKKFVTDIQSLKPEVEQLNQEPLTIREQFFTAPKIEPSKLISSESVKVESEKLITAESVKVESEKLITAESVKVEPDKLIPKDESENEEIIEKLNELIEVIKADNALEKEQQDYDKKIEFEEKRKKREKRIEVGKIFTINRTVDKVIKKSQSIFDSLIKFLAFTLLGQIVKFVTDFLRDPKNKEFIDNSINFIKSIPDRLREVRDKLLPVIDWFKEQGPKIAKFAEDFRKLLTRFPFLGQYFATKKEKEEGLKSAPGTILRSEQGVPLPRTGPFGAPQFIPMFAAGGMMMGMGTDTVPAMLTPGEFVMSRGAVNMFGADTMMAMNKAGGGTNIPKFGLVSGYSGGGFVEKMGMTRSQFEIYKREVANIESKGSGGYSAKGGAGDHYDGKYQMGEVAKMDAARLLGERFPGHDAAARAAFRADPAIQERYFEAYTKANHGYMMSDPLFANATPQRKLEILGYAHNQGWAKALDWLNTGEVGRDKFGTKGTKYVDAINKAFGNNTSSPTAPPAPPVLPPPGFDSDKGDTRFDGIDLDFIFKPLRQFLGVDTPNAPTSTKIIVLPPIKQQAKQPTTTTQTSNEIPDFRVSSGVQMRGLVGKALGIEDLVS